MKVLHTKAMPSRILLASACPNMNLLAVVTRTSLQLYRSTTLTVVLSAQLHMADTTSSSSPSPSSSAENEDEFAGVAAGWSPSGRFFSLALPDGVVLIFDVETAELVRRMAPRTSIAAWNASGVFPASVGMCHSDSRHNSADDDDDEEEDEMEDERTLLRPSPLLVPLSTVEGPIYALTWISVPLATPRRPNHGEAACLPLPHTNTLTEEVECCSPHGNERSVAMLLLLDAAGGLSCALGGLREVDYLRLSLPMTLSPSLHVEQLRIVMVPPPSAPEDEDDADDGFWTMGKDATTHPSSRTHHHVGLLSVRASGADAAPTLMKLCLGRRLCGWAQPAVVDVCAVAEHCQVALAYAEEAKCCWSSFLRRRVYARLLKLPQSAELLATAVMEDVSKSHHDALCGLWRHVSAASSTTPAVMDRLLLLPRRLAEEVYATSLACLDVAMSLAVAAHTQTLHMPSTAASDDATWLELIGVLRRNTESFLRRMRCQADHAGELIQWAVQRASLIVPSRDGAPGVDEVVATVEPLSVARQPTLRRTLIAILHGRDTSWAEESEDPKRVGEKLERLLQQRLRTVALGVNSEDVVVDVAPVQIPGAMMDANTYIDVNVEEVESADDDDDDDGSKASPSTDVSCVGRPVLHVVQDQPSSSITMLSSFLTQPWQMESNTNEEEHPCVSSSATEVKQLDIINAASLQEGEGRRLRTRWYGLVNRERRLLLASWSTSSADASTKTNGSATLVLAMVDERGQVLRSNSADDDEDDDDDDDEGNESENDGGGDDASVLVLSGMPSVHCEVSLSPSREFCLVVCRNKMVVVDVFEG